ncbi:acetyltransferase [Niveispirillum lacus]|uniref:Acetyltransferase n=1 Tax=Niveispirillum lacus TaxID=1981099 RepID=A0A255YWP1_9PROT|nr:acetyltransferase [Niveispirillum lacus]OYQ33618.1 acetyltransferase [Niveispirillum lacus]
MPTAIRLSTPADNASIHRVWRASVDATHGFIAPADVALYEHLLVTLYLPSKPLWLALSPDGVIQGFIGLAGPKIEALFVHPDWHRQGVGRRLIAHALGLRQHLVVDVNVQNPGAVDFYVSQGFLEIGRSPVDHAGKPYPLIHMAKI